MISRIILSLCNIALIVDKNAQNARAKRRGCKIFYVHYYAQVLLSELITQALEAEFVRSGMGARRFESNLGLPKWSLRGLLDPKKKRVPSVDKADEICRAINLELRIVPVRPRRRGRAQPDSKITAINSLLDEQRFVDAVSALADSFAASNEHSRSGLLIRFWAAYPELRCKEP
ncbi:MAG: hypothetical protein F4X97_10165 [Boseongicola sp. SB0662_bin_57]|nr:hypothetical protein [Boseongicola sp. SB0662_bin_57]